MAASEADLSRLEVRPLTELDEFQQTLSLQKRIWGFDEADVVAPRLFSVSRHVGGSVLGAFIAGEMVGYTLAFAAFKNDHRVYWHSHMAGIIPELQGRGIGRRLKFRQREEALSANIDLIEWTFDPLRVGNALFNLERLGAVVSEYLPNLYGVTSSELHGSLPTDRLVASWRLESPRVCARVKGESVEQSKLSGTIEIPKDVSDLPPDEALDIQARVRSRFQSAFEDGLEVTGFEPTEAGGSYLLTRRVM